MSSNQSVLGAIHRIKLNSLLIELVKRFNALQTQPPPQITSVPFPAIPRTRHNPNGRTKNDDFLTLEEYLDLILFLPDLLLQNLLDNAPLILTPAQEKVLDGLRSQWAYIFLFLDSKLLGSAKDPILETASLAKYEPFANVLEEKFRLATAIHDKCWLKWFFASPKSLWFWDAVAQCKFQLSQSHLLVSLGLENKLPDIYGKTKWRQQNYQHFLALEAGDEIKYCSEQEFLESLMDCPAFYLESESIKRVQADDSFEEKFWNPYKAAWSQVRRTVRKPENFVFSYLDVYGEEILIVGKHTNQYTLTERKRSPRLYSKDLLSG